VRGAAGSNDARRCAGDLSRNAQSSDLTFAPSQDARSQSERQIQSSTGINILLAVL